MLMYPEINPIAFSLGPLKVHWYGLMYLIGFSLAWALLQKRRNAPQQPWTATQVNDLIFYGALGVLFGGRIGYMLFYAFPVLLKNPLELFKVWDGGMSFHGGLIGVLIIFFLIARTQKRHFFDIADFMAPVVPLGLAAGRLGNFINQELWGRVTAMPWGIVYPKAGPLTRHPSELYEFLLEGILLFIVLWTYSRKRRPRMAVSGLFLLGYGIARMIAECFRQPDPQLGFLAWDWLTMGQVLSLPMVAFGFFMIWFAYRKG